MDQQQRGRGRARGRARGGQAGQQPQQQPGPRPGGAPAWGPPQQQRGPPPQQQRPQPGPPQQMPPQQAAGAWGQRQAQQQQQVRAPAPQPQSMQAGRASYRGGGDSAAPGPEGRLPTAEITGAGDTLATHGHGAIRGRRRIFENILRTRPDQLVSKQGSFGSAIKLTANYFRLTHDPNWNLFQYRVDFAPEEDNTGKKKGLLRTATKDLLAGYLFDGTVLYTPNRLNPDPLELFVQNDAQVNFRITIRMVGEVATGDYHRLQVFNIILRKAMGTLKLQLIGRNFFDAVAKVAIPEHKLELWPGYITSIRQHEREILLGAEITSKVMRMDTVYHLLTECLREDRANYKRNFQSKIIGSVVLTDYNNRTYHIDDVDFNTRPNSTFQKADGSSISYVDYYRSRYQLNIRDADQPMLISRAKAREIRAGMQEIVYLVPELCRMTGLTDTQRANFQLMRSLAEHTRVAPTARIQKLLQFRERLQRTPESLQVLKEWNLGLSNALVELNGRVLPPEVILGGEGIKYNAGRDAEWIKDLRSNPMFHMVSLDTWVLVTPKRCKQSAQKFVQCIQSASKGMRFQMTLPRLHEIEDDRPGTYVGALEQVASLQPKLIMCIASNNKKDRYDAIKKKLTVDYAIPSQVILAKNLDSKGTMSIATKVAIQLNCKLGGAPWALPIPVAGLMIVGYDVCHDTSNRTKSFGAMVASLDRFATRYYNIASAHANGEELSNDFSLNMVKACKEFAKNNGNQFPEKIIIYRDGVGDGQLEYVIEHEVAQIKQRLTEVIYKQNNLKLAFIVVSKRINTRVFVNGQNPPPGTVIDDAITLPERYDFFIVSQCVRQGTVAPTSYNIISDTSTLSADHLQRLTYKLTHMYYNWTGTVRVPAPCQYAHKLAFLTGQSLHRQPHQELDTVLHYL